MIDTEQLEKLKKLLETKPNTIVIVAENIDPDALGGSIGMYLALKKMDIPVELASLAKIPENIGFLKEVKDIKTDFDEKKFDAIFFIDCGDKKMIGYHETKPYLISNKITKINIDHHFSNDNFGDINFVNPKAASATMIVFEVLKKLKIDISPDIATALLLGIYGDTGGFMHQNTTPDCYASAAELVRLGANIHKIAKNVFRSYDLKTLKLWAKVLQNLHITSDGAAIVGVEKEDYESIGASREDLNGIIDFINSMPEARYSVLLSEDENKNVKASLRTRRPDIDVKALAEKFGGGGHIKASGFTIKGGHLEKEVKWKIIQS